MLLSLVGLNCAEQAVPPLVSAREVNQVFGGTGAPTSRVPRPRHAVAPARRTARGPCPAAHQPDRQCVGQTDGVEVWLVLLGDGCGVGRLPRLLARILRAIVVGVDEIEAWLARLHANREGTVHLEGR